MREMSDSDDYSDIECDHVLTGAEGRVVMLKSVTSEFLKIDTRKQARLLSNAKLWADGLRPNAEQFQGNEGRCGGDNDRMLVAVKVHKIRLYGFIRRGREIKTLLIVEIDAAKKQKKPCPRTVGRAKLAVVSLDSTCGD